MGLLDKLKKKKDSEKNPSSSDLPETENLDDDTDLFTSDIEDELDEFDSIDLEEDFTSKEDQGQTSTKKAGKGIFVSLIFLFIGIILVAGGVWYYYSTLVFPLASETTKKFFKHLKDSHNNAYRMMDQETYRENIKGDDFRLMLESSAYYFDKIESVHFEEKDFKKSGSNSFLQGKIRYLDQLSGEFKIKFILREGKKLFVTGFKVNSDARRKYEDEEAYKAVQEIVGTFSKDKIDQLDGKNPEEVFGGCFHKNVAKAWGDEATVKLIQLYQQLSEMGFKKHTFTKDNYVSRTNVERTYKSESTTKSGNVMNSEITVFYESGRWYVTNLEFTPAI